MQVVSVPYNLFPSLFQALRDMPWVLPAYEPDGLEYVRRLKDGLGLD
jgi:hypothetical protein